MLLSAAKYQGYSFYHFWVIRIKFVKKEYFWFKTEKVNIP